MPICEQSELQLSPQQLADSLSPWTSKSWEFLLCQSKECSTSTLGILTNNGWEEAISSLLSTFIVGTRGMFNKDEAWLENIKTYCTTTNASMKSLEMQVTQLANAIKNQSEGKFSSDIEQNLRINARLLRLEAGRKLNHRSCGKLEVKKLRLKKNHKRWPQSQTPYLFWIIVQSSHHDYRFLNDFKRKSWTINSLSSLRSLRRYTSISLFWMLWSKCPTMPSLWKRWCLRREDWWSMRY